MCVTYQGDSIDFDPTTQTSVVCMHVCFSVSVCLPVCLSVSCNMTGNLSSQLLILFTVFLFSGTSHGMLQVLKAAELSYSSYVLDRPVLPFKCYYFLSQGS